MLIPSLSFAEFFAVMVPVDAVCILSYALAIDAIQRALAKGVHTHIVVDGEEDLLTLIAVLYAPENSFVIYGQPHSGIVVVKVTDQRKCQVQEFLNAMKVSKS